MHLHDTHVHLDLLLEKLAIITDLDRNDPASVPVFDHTRLDELLLEHEFVIQSTLSAKNYLVNKNLFGYNSKVFYLFGMHPEDVDQFTDTDQVIAHQERVLKESSKDLTLVGIGEIGLDYYWSEDPQVHAKQAVFFEHHLELAARYKLPAVIHIRDKQGETKCMQDALAVINNHPGIIEKFAVHCFSGNQQDADKILNMGGYLGFGGIVTYNSGKEILEIAKNCPLSKILLETDLPFLSPTPHRGKICLPEYIKIVAETLATAKALSANEIWLSTSRNAHKFFNLKS